MAARGKAPDGTFYGEPGVIGTSGSAIYLGGMLTGVLPFAGSTLGSTSSGGDVMLLKYDADGNELWGRTWADPTMVGKGWVSGIAVTPDENVWLAGVYDNEIAFGAQTFHPSGGVSIFLAGLTQEGVLTAATSLSDAFQPSTWVLLAAGSAGAVVLSTVFESSLRIGATTVSVPDGAQGAMLVASLDPATSFTPIWTKVFASAETAALSLSPCGQILVAGNFGAPLDFGCGSMAAKSTADVFWASLGPN